MFGGAFDRWRAKYLGGIRHDKRFSKASWPRWPKPVLLMIGDDSSTKNRAAKAMLAPDARTAANLAEATRPFTSTALPSIRRRLAEPAQPAREFVDDYELLFRSRGSSTLRQSSAAPGTITRGGQLTARWLCFRDVTEAHRATAPASPIAEARPPSGNLPRIAHDFNNMLTVITGTIEILAMALPTGPTCTQSPGWIDPGGGPRGSVQAPAQRCEAPLQPRQYR